MPSARTSWPRTSSSSGRVEPSSCKCCPRARKARWPSSTRSHPGAKADRRWCAERGSALRAPPDHAPPARAARKKERTPMRRMSAKTFRLAAMTTASAAVAACGLSSAAPTNTLLSGPTGRPITIGVSEPLSGPQQAQGFATDGQACLRGYELWASDVNSHGGLLGRPVRLKVLNDKGDIGLTKANYRTLITQDHVDLTLAPFSSLLVSQAAGPVTQQYKYVLPAGQAGAPAVYALHDPYLFSTNVPVKLQMVPFATWVSNLPPGQRPATAAYPYVNNPFAQPPVQAAQKIMQNHGITTVYTTPGQGYNDLSPAALRADARKVVARNPGIVVLGSVDLPTVQAFIQDFIAQKWNPKIFIAAAGPDQGQGFINA